ncbi:hypothetical protein BC938DRAFT_472404 [Jimgerdemannia flammicorona]|uniref:Uncharacterized protein n=1 Tax=Jimgerdemannia flammicorona TaxID=994334 RepID=A0A433Q663_9FUNG|nr:hypothetical protein BC938DRAFT_472404 [Jimgerdemannia flammicorona]
MEAGLVEHRAYNVRETSSNENSNFSSVCAKSISLWHSKTAHDYLPFHIPHNQDCGDVVAAKFFPIDGPGGKQHPLCERDYFRRLNLVCEACGGALRGSYITALDKKYHIEHFTCSVCPTVFGPDDSYYEHDGKVYCHYHYSLQFAVKCAGCQTAILKQFVEINRNQLDEHWHPECYMINKFWNVKLSQPFGTEEENQRHQPDTSRMTAEELREEQRVMEEKVYQIWTVLSAFEESSAACISDMLLHVSNGAYVDGVKMAERFIVHVEVLFGAIDDLEVQYKEYADNGLHHSREAKMLCKKIVNFFSLLSHTQEAGMRRLGITQELLSLVTGLAHYLKILIRIALTGALKLERQYHNTQSISRFLSKLMELANRERAGRNRRAVVDPEVTSDSCTKCKVTVEEQCFKFAQYRWHVSCLICSKCERVLRDSYRGAMIEPKSRAIYCSNCARGRDNVTIGFEYVTQLEQYTFLLRVALRRLYKLLKVPEDASSGGEETRGRSTSSNNAPPGLLRKDSRSKSYSGGGEQNYDTIHLGDIKRMKSTHMDRKLTNSHRIAKRSTLMETPSPDAAHSAILTDRMDSALDVTSVAPSRKSEASGEEEDRGPEVRIKELGTFGSADAITLADMAHVATSRQNQYRKPMDRHSKFYLAELSALEYFIIKHIAVLSMEQMMKEFFTLEELLDLIESRKATLWGKFVTSLKAGNQKKPKTKSEGTFGVPIDVLVEKNGVESNLGAGPSQIRIPSFIDDAISAMKQMDMSVEGIFRKNGNIRRLKELSEAIDRNPAAINLSDEYPVQVAALLKKFLRDLPDPLLTFKLHRLFVCSQKLESEAARKKVLHLACCLLPKVHRDTMEVLFLFLKWVASFSHIDAESGSKMDLANLARVITPNILYAKGKDPTKDESFMAIEAVNMLLKYQEEFCAVPDEFAPLIQDQELLDSNMELTTKDILKKCETLLKLKKSHSSGDIQVEAAEQHTPSIAAVVSQDGGQ